MSQQLRVVTELKLNYNLSQLKFKKAKDFAKSMATLRIGVGVVVEENNGSKNDSSTLVSKLISEHTKRTSDQV